MRWNLLAMHLAVAGLSMAMAASPLVAQEEEEEEQPWPCIQRKVPHLSLPQIWTGPDLPPAAENWSEDDQVAALVAEVATRRVPIEEAQERIREFSESLTGEARLFMLVRGLFDHMDSERADVMAGIERYTRSQVAMANAVRREAEEVDALRDDPDADPEEVARRIQEFDFQARVFQERAQSLTYVCEVPTLIEQRLYRLSNTVANLLKPSDGG